MCTLSRRGQSKATCTCPDESWPARTHDGQQHVVQLGLYVSGSFALPMSIMFYWSESTWTEAGNINLIRREGSAHVYNNAPQLAKSVHASASLDVEKIFFSCIGITMYYDRNCYYIYPVHTRDACAWLCIWNEMTNRESTKGWPAVCVQLTYKDLINITKVCLTPKLVVEFEKAPWTQKLDSNTL